MNDLLVEGILADVDGVRPGRVRIEKGVIVDVGDAPGEPDLRFGDDCLIFAGMGDVHIHAREDVTRKDVHKETFATAAAAAIGGGVVHVSDMPNNPAPPIDDSTYAAKAALIHRCNPAVHFTLYAGIGPGTRPLSKFVPYKAYMGPSVGDLYFTSLQQIDDTLGAYRGCWVSFHCEDPELLEAHKGASTHEGRRPPVCEINATRFALEMMAKHQLIGKVCHFSVAEGLPLLKEARRNRVPVTVEVTPHHLYFDTSMLSSHNRPVMQMNPPLRSAEDRQALLDALRNGDCDYLATDHAPHTTREKAFGASGQPHLDTYGAFVTWLINEQGFTPQRIAAVCSANPGIFVNNFTDEKFGRLLPGYTGSLTVLNLRRSETIRAQNLRTLCGWSPFEGMSFPGSVESVVIRGQVVQ